MQFDHKKGFVMSSLVENADGSVTVKVTPLKAVISETFVKLGCSELEATRIAERLAGANLRGHDSHGVIRAPRYANYIEEGTQIPNVTVDIKIENETLAVESSMQISGGEEVIHVVATDRR